VAKRQSLIGQIFSLTTAIPAFPKSDFCSRFMAEQATLSGIRNHELLEMGYKFDSGEVIKRYSELCGCLRNQPFYRAFISSNFESARSNLLLKSHIASKISRTVADVLALSACPKAKMLLFRRYTMTVGSEIR